MERSSRTLGGSASQPQLFSLMRKNYSDTWRKPIINLPGRGENSTKLPVVSSPALSSSPCNVLRPLHIPPPLFISIIPWEAISRRITIIFHHRDNAFAPSFLCFLAFDGASLHADFFYLGSHSPLFTTPEMPTSYVSLMQFYTTPEDAYIL